MDVSERVLVAVVTRPRLELLGDCIDSLAASGVATGSSPFDLVVVENGGRASAVEELLSVRSIAGEVVTCTQVGIPFARNAALDLAQARGHRGLLFIDDDQRVTAEALGVLWTAIRAAPEHRLLKCMVGGPRTFQPRGGREPSATGTGGLYIPASIYSGPDGQRFLETWPSDGGTDGEFTARAVRAGARISLLAGCEVIEVVHSGRERFRRRVWSAARRRQTSLLIQHLHFDRPLTRRRRRRLLVRALRGIPAAVGAPRSDLLARVLADALTAAGLAIREYSPPYVVRLFPPDGPLRAGRPHRGGGRRQGTPR